MKSTKNIFMLGVALTITLFASIQVTAMEPNTTINPNLARNEIHQLKSDIKQLKRRLKNLKNTTDASPEMQASLERTIEQKRTMLYGDEPYTTHEIMGVTHIKK